MFYFRTHYWRENEKIDKQDYTARYREFARPLFLYLQKTFHWTNREESGLFQTSGYRRVYPDL